MTDSLRDALERTLENLPTFINQINDQPVQALPKSALLDLLAKYPAEPCPDCGLTDDHKGGCPQTGEAPQPGAPG